MESEGEKGRIQVSQETADLLIGSGKSHWVRLREDTIVAKGKGELHTYWLDPARVGQVAAQPEEIERLPRAIQISAHSSPKRGYPDSPIKSMKKQTAFVSMVKPDESVLAYSTEKPSKSTQVCSTDMPDKKPPSSEELNANLGSTKSPRRLVSGVLPRTLDSVTRSSPPKTPRRSMMIPNSPMLFSPLTSIDFISASSRNLRLKCPERDALQEEKRRLINMTTTILFGYLKDVMKNRRKSNSLSTREVVHSTERCDLPPPLDLLADVIFLPNYDPYAERCDMPNAEDLSKAENDLKKYLSDIAVLYNPIPFHNFEVCGRVDSKDAAILFSCLQTVSHFLILSTLPT
jgi:hypothetical protein